MEPDLEKNALRRLIPPCRLTLGDVARYIILVVSVLGIIMVLNVLYNVVGPGDSLGQADDSCARGDLASASNGSGIVATAHDLDCDYGLAHGPETIFVYVHRSDEGDSRKSLIFRYNNFDSFDEPRMSWNDSTHLRVSVPEVGEISKQVGSVGSTEIIYSIGKMEVSPEEHSRDNRTLAEILLAVLIFLLGICALTFRSIRRQGLRQLNKASS